ncbi:MAG: RagB/SusD family nutrient uptake outer membrane protein [Gammaproteobacteria bacterium]|nr:RagB/SusD family nutrient uptake outer membrane protein [Gammaproteobacteria bacterium]
MSSRRKNTRGHGRRRAMWPALVAAPLLTLALGACDFDEILQVDLPGDVTEPDLTDPALAETLALSVQADFECGLVDYVWYAGLWYSEFLNASSSRPNALMELRAQLVDVYADPCSSGTGPVYGPMMTPRLQAVRVKDFFAAYESGAVPNATELLAGVSLYQGYAEQIMGEYHCGVVVLDPVQYPEGGPLGTRQEAWQRAIELFNEAVSGGTADVRNAAYVGIARANLNLGNMAAVVSNADLVPEGFQFNATYSTDPDRRRNKIARRNHEDQSLMPHRYYGVVPPNDYGIPPSNMTISADGRATWADRMGGMMSDNAVNDPRVEIYFDDDSGKPLVDNRNGTLDYRFQRKYSDRADPIPFATWREAQLMKAEALGGQDAVDIINLLRTNPAGLHANIDSSAWPLPTADYLAGASDAEIMEAVREERRRELFGQGTRGGDKIRWNETYEIQNEYGFEMENGRPLPISFLEVASNPNVSSTC